MGRIIGYARVSTAEQDLSLQLDALRQAGCAEEEIFLDVASGTYTTRPGLEACLQALTMGDQTAPKEPLHWCGIKSTVPRV
jgi:DNA invertase Pin-like site-specific DNA recombinase